MHKRLAWLAIAPALAAANDASVPIDDGSACLSGPLEQFGRYIGDWRIEDSQLSDDGSEWLPGAGAQWNFVCIGNGTAIQDFWMPEGGGVGTNLRTYNADTGSWDIAWTFTGMAGFAHIQAKENDEGNIVMHYKSPLPDPLRRITFFPPTESGWNWKLEVSSDGGESWLEVYRISASRSDAG
ncbi:MAG: hypothetical protein AAF417_06125 [Pseudomonadota bacterium]